MIFNSLLIFLKFKTLIYQFQCFEIQNTLERIKDYTIPLWKKVAILQEGGSTHILPTLFVVRVVLLHKQGDRAILYFLKCKYSFMEKCAMLLETISSFAYGKFSQKEIWKTRLIMLGKWVPKYLGLVQTNIEHFGIWYS